MTRISLENGVCLSRLSKTHSAASMINLVGEYFMKNGRYEKATSFFELVLKYFPKSVYSMVKAGSGYYKLLQREFKGKYHKFGEIPLYKRSLFFYYVKKNDLFFEKAENLGWREHILSGDEKPQ